ncbi:response regulator [Mucilaginibacter limnophilus]|uniref:Response regulator n=1 Tax=Mucilaginibacter limnophilus TaxID=1932778 RepID=A0A3S2UN32_9SPHI|nr:response regulator [Mucilaginibacter limnophilus]RVU02455.1 response regulator [Mucilaginibacter limnophilus]
MCKLMVLDDDPIQHLIFRRMLNRYKLAHETFYSYSGYDVLSFLSAHKKDTSELPEVIFMDINMPGLNGWAFLDRFKDLYPQLNKLIEIHIVSSSINPSEIKRTDMYDFVKSYIVKPITSERLEQILEPH